MAYHPWNVFSGIAPSATYLSQEPYPEPPQLDSPFTFNPCEPAAEPVFNPPGRKWSIPYSHTVWNRKPSIHLQTEACIHGFLPDKVRLDLPPTVDTLLCGEALGPRGDDSWHRGMKCWIVPSRPLGSLFLEDTDIFFTSKKDNAPGVSLWDAKHGTDIVEDETFRQRGFKGEFYPFWPGYPHIAEVNRSYKLNYRNASLTDVAIQVGHIMWNMLEECAAGQGRVHRRPSALGDPREAAFYFENPVHRDMRWKGSQGSGAGIDIGQVRLLKLATADGRRYWAEFSVVAPK